MENKYITVAYKLYVEENGKPELVEEATTEHPFLFISGLGTALERFENEITPLAEGDKFEFVIPCAEAYGEYMPKENSAVSLFGKYDNLIVPKTFSKGFGLAGMRAGYILMPESLHPYMTNITNPYCMSELSRSVAAKTIRNEAFLNELLAETARLKRMILDYPWKNIYPAVTADTVSICLLQHKNPDVDMAAEFAKFRIWVYSGSDFDTIDKNACRFRVPAAKDMDRVMEALKAIDAID